MATLVSYSRWRAILAFALPLFGLAIPLGNWVISPADFRHRYLGDWVTAIPLVLALMWFMYALWPSALRLLAGGPKAVRLDDERLTFDPGPSFRLADLKAVEILRPLLQHPRVEVRFSDGKAAVETAYQTLGLRKSPDDIAQSIAVAARAATAATN